MEAKNKFPLIRKLLGAISLSPEAVDDIIDRITDFLSDKGDKSAGEPVYPYVLNENFLSLAEHNFFSVLKTTVAGQAHIIIKVGLVDLFEVKSKAQRVPCLPQQDRPRTRRLFALRPKDSPPAGGN